MSSLLYVPRHWHGIMLHATGILENQKAKVDSAAYVVHLRHQLLPVCDYLHPDVYFLQQNGAPIL